MAEEVSATKMFGGYNRTFKHASKECDCEMTFAIYYPPQAESKKVPVSIYLSGLTCTHENFIQKSGGQRVAAQLGIAVVVPDTSPRGLGIEGEDESYDFGTGAGFYLDATLEKWKQYRMYSYVTKELQGILDQDSKLDTSTMAIFGHSMGGHGALTIGLKNAEKFKAISAFSPICHPSECPWGIKALSGYLGDDKSKWAEYDATALLKDYSGPKLPVLIDTGTADNPYKEGQLKPEDFKAANEGGKLDLDLRMQEGYDHSYFFIATFVEDHLRMHAKAMGL